MIRRNPRRGFAMTGRTGPRRHIRVIERRRRPGRCSMTVAAGSRRQSTFMARGDAC
jgi:hypothetical protein